MFTKKFYKEFVKSLTVVKSILRKELKAFVAKGNYQ